MICLICLNCGEPIGEGRLDTCDDVCSRAFAASLRKPIELGRYDDSVQSYGPPDEDELRAMSYENASRYPDYWRMVEREREDTRDRW